MPTGVLGPSGVLGPGFDREALVRGVAICSDIICIDGGSIDGGPFNPVRGGRNSHAPRRHRIGAC